MKIGPDYTDPKTPKTALTPEERAAKTTQRDALTAELDADAVAVAFVEYPKVVDGVTYASAEAEAKAKEPAPDPTKAKK